MKNIKYLLFLLIPIGICASCESFLDKQPTGDLSLDDVFSNRVYAQGFLSNIYHRLPYESNVSDMWNEHRFNGNPFAAGSDEMEIAFGGSYTHFLNSGAWNSSNISACNIWEQSYIAIRECNLFLERLQEIPTSQVEKNSWEGELYFLRAYFHFMLMRTHGPIVLLEHSLKTDENFTQYKRSPIQKCAQFISDDCDRAINLLSGYPQRAHNDLGRITLMAPLALKSRVWLYAASPLWNGNPDYETFLNVDNEQLVPSGSPDKLIWEKAADAALECITIAEANGHGLYYSSSNDPYDNYFNIWQEYYNKEWLFWKHEGEYRHVDQCADPISFPSSASIYNPTQDLVDAYEMADGTTPILGYLDEERLQPIINPASGYSEDHFVNDAERALDPSGRYYPTGIWSMYANREPRFYASINFCLQEWKESSLQFFYRGKDGRGSAGSDYCKTGYLMRKLVDESYRSANRDVYRPKIFVYFRMAEIYLNYAEALFESQGDIPLVRQYVNLIRERSGLPNLPLELTTEELREKIHHERRIELAFESHRWFDVRRWKKPEYMGKSISGMNIMDGKTKSDPKFYIRTKIEDRVFEKQHYLFPIPQDEINKNIQNLVQNPWW